MATNPSTATPLAAPISGKKAVVNEILKHCQGVPSIGEEKLTEIDDEAKTAKWDPCNTLINDAIHGPVELNSLLTAILNTPEFQRLRFIKQLGGGCYVYPGANHTRFDHSIGVCYIAGEFGLFLKRQFQEECEHNKKLKSDSPRKVTEVEVLCLQIAGLCHDLGHGPFSHTFEHRVLDRMEDVSVSHEELSLKVFEKIMTNHTVLIQFVYVYNLGFDEFVLIKDMIHPKRSRKPDEQLLKTRTGKQFLLEIVANKDSGIDVDKWDYFTRDCHYLGIAMDFQWKRCMLLSRTCKDAEDKYHIAFRNKEVDNLYGMGRTRSTLHRKAYVHKTKVAVEEMFARAINKVKDVPLITVASNSERNTVTIAQAIHSTLEGDLQWFMMLNDVSVTTLIMHWSPLNGKVTEQHKKSISDAQNLLKRIERRQLYHLLVEPQRFPKYKNLQDKPKTDADREEVASWNVTCMMTKIKNNPQKESERKERLEKLNVEVFGSDSETAQSTFIEIVSISFGSEKKTDPMQGVLFYGKDQPDIAEEWNTLGIKRTSSSLVVPKHFTEYEIRLYYTGAEQLEKTKQEAISKFKTWLNEKIYKTRQD